MPYHRHMVFLAAAGCLAIAAATANGRTNDPLLVIYPQKWESATTNYIAFKSRLGFQVYTGTVENITGGATNDFTIVRAYLANFQTSTVPAGKTGCVLLLGNYHAVPAPVFNVITSDSPYSSDIYYADLHTDFNADGDAVFAEYDAGGGQDFDAAGFNAAFPGISNDLAVGRIPVESAWTAASVEAVLDHMMAFEREVSARKRQAILSAGRIATNFPADSWDYVIKDLAKAVTNGYPGRQVVTVAHVATDYVDRTGIDHVVEGSDISADYTVGQNIIRGLWQSNDACAFLCNCSHGGSTYDFALRRNGAGFPTNVHSAIVISMSCASYNLGAAAVTNGLSATYLGSCAVVTPDVLTIPFGDMVSATVQRQAALSIFGQGNTVGETFREQFDYYVEHIQTAGLGLTYASYKPEILRNVVGFQVIGDPTLVHAYDDQDADELLDPEEEYLGTTVTNADTDADGLPDGLEFRTPGYDPLVDNGPDVDSDLVSNADEIVAGTDPFASNSYPRVRALAADTNDHPRIEWDSVTGRTYQVWTSPSLNPPAWTNHSPEWPGTGDGMMIEMTNDAAAMFYRLVIWR